VQSAVNVNEIILLFVSVTFPALSLAKDLTEALGRFSVVAAATKIGHLAAHRRSFDAAPSLAGNSKLVRGIFLNIAFL